MKFVFLVFGLMSISLHGLVINEDFVLDESKIFKRVIKAFNSKIEKKEQTRCLYLELDKSEDVYIIELEIIGNRSVNHHMSLGLLRDIYDMDYQENGNTIDCKNDNVNGRDSRRIYTWALDAAGIKFPNGIGIKASGSTGLKYLALGLHYNGDLPIGFVDNNSAYILTMTTQKLPYQVGVYTLGDSLSDIPPKRERFHMESACEYNLPYDMVPLAYRTHAHIIIPVISGYVIKNNKWIELGRMSPHQPQQFYPVTNKNVIVRKGDILATRCTANSMERTELTLIGERHTDEMCAFYLQYYTDYPGNLHDIYCYPPHIYSFKKNIRSAPPRNSDSLEGVHLIKPEYELMKH